MSALQAAIRPIAVAVLMVALALAVGPAAPTESSMPGAATWKEVEDLIEDERFEAAASRAAELREAAQAAGDAEEWARGLILETQLRIGLHGYETAVRQLREQPWPEEPLQRSVLHLFYGQSLVHYARAYSWEIRQRERVASDDEVDLRAWTLDQIYTAAQDAYLAAWNERESWGSEPLGALAEYIDQNDYPARIRGTLRDAVSYLFVELLADSSLWRPDHSQEIFRLALDRLAEGSSGAFAEVELAGSATHPLEKIAAVLADLEGWHREHDRPEAAFEARRERLERLRASFTQEEDRRRLREDLEAQTRDLGRRWGWWSMGMATLAEWVREEPDPEALVRARALALECLEPARDSTGAQRCRRLVAEIEAPSYGLTAMASDGPDRRSLQVEHRNLERLHFRAYAVDLERRIAQARDYNLLPGYREVPALLRQRPVAEWQVELPPTPDYRSHATYVTPPLTTSGLYVVVASAGSRFEARGNLLQAVNFLLTDLVLLSRVEDDEVAVAAHSGESGQPLAGVKVRLYRYDWQSGHQAGAPQSTDRHGEARLRLARGRASHFLLARHGEHLALDASHLYALPPEAEPESTRSLVYTDRSVYRPQQTILWKVVVYSGDVREGRLRVAPNAGTTVELRDANGDVVASREVIANEYGSASGEFEIPAGRLLGRWQVHARSGDAATVLVEEYKRPTFEVSVDEPEETLRLNRPATLRGEARYYFGLPVVSGRVGWQVTREPVYPIWWRWLGYGVESSRIVAAGTSGLDSRGRFGVTFTPEADEREAATGVSYRYRLSVDVTDDGGETRSASRLFRLGFVSVEARVEEARGFLPAGEPAALTVRRTDLDGAPRPGDATWELLRLEEPETTLLPAEQPLPPLPPGQEEAFQTPGDRLRPRWNPQYSAEGVLRLWPDGASVAGGSVEHDAGGRAALDLPALPGGAYRVRYRTQDPFGADFELTHELVVAAAGQASSALPALLLVEEGSVPVGGVARVLVASGLSAQPLLVEIQRRGAATERRRLASDEGVHVLEIPVGPEQRGGFGVTLTALRDHQPMQLATRVSVPWDDRRLEVELATFRDRLRPGERETWSVTVRGSEGAPLEEGTAELLAYMYDRSLDLFAEHSPPDPLRLYPDLAQVRHVRTTLGASRVVWRDSTDFVRLPDYPRLQGDSLRWLSGYGIGGLGRRIRMAGARGEMDAMESAMPAPPPPSAPEPQPDAPAAEPDEDLLAETEPVAEPLAEEALRTDFSETAFWEPHLLLGGDGSATIEFTVPDSVTEWNVWAHALTRDLRAGSVEGRTRTVKELMVRPYLPRFLREGDRAELRVAVDNAGEQPLGGTVRLELLDPETEASLLADFGLTAERARMPFQVEAGAGSTVTFSLATPVRVGPTVVRVSAAADGFADGEQRALPVLPGRMHLAQSRFAALHGADSRTLRFDDLAADDDPTRIDDQMVVTIDGQLFYTVLSALPYLVSFPYECTEQTLNRFVSTGIVSSVFERHPAVARMAAEMASLRETRFEPWKPDDPNRKLALEETPWLALSRGGREAEEDLIRLLDPEVAAAHRDAAIAQLREAQTAVGGFPWFPGGPPSPYMTLYLLHGFSKALEHGVPVPEEMVRLAWGYMHRHYLDEIVRSMRRDDCCWELVTFLNYVLSAYPDETWTGGVFTARERGQMLDFSFRHWRRHSPLLKAQLALTLHRADRGEDAGRVFASIMESARTTEDEGTFWAPEERAWLWYHDTIDTHAFALRALSELAPDDERRHGLVQWLLLNKKLNHWKSTRATAEVIYALIGYLEKEGALGVREEARVVAGPVAETFVFEPDALTGKGNQMVIPGEEVTPAMAEVTVSKETPGFLFASATWHFSTEELPEASRGDLLGVERSYFRRVADGDGWRLEPLADGTALAVGDQVEVHLSLSARHSAEHIHLQDPRGASFEPETLVSLHKWDLGLGWYEEVRDSATNFFFEYLPAGEYTLKYRLRASMAGTFRVGPATLQSMYAPEFTAYSAGALLDVDPYLPPHP